MTETATPRRMWRLSGLATLWVFLCLFAVAPVSLLVELLARVSKNPSLATDTVFTVAIEALILTVMSYLVFRAGRALRLPIQAWVIGPVGYLMSLAVLVVITRVVLNTDMFPRGAGWAYVIGDILATSLGAWGGMERRRTIRIPSPDRAAG